MSGAPHFMFPAESGMWDGTGIQNDKSFLHLQPVKDKDIKNKDVRCFDLDGGFHKLSLFKMLIIFLTHLRKFKGIFEIVDADTADRKTVDLNFSFEKKQHF